jgi:hypothetical protein
MTTFAMVDVGRSTDVADLLLLVEKGLSLLDIVFLSSHAEHLVDSRGCNGNAPEGT